MSFLTPQRAKHNMLLLLLLFSYWALGLHGSYGLIYLVLLGVSTSSICLAYMFGAVMPTLDAANAALPSFVSLCLLFGKYTMMDLWDSSQFSNRCEAVSTGFFTNACVRESSE